MPRTAEQLLQAELGRLTFALIVKQAEIERLQARVADLERQK